MNDSEQNPYAPPAPPPPKPARLGVFLIGFLGLQIVGNIYLAYRMLFDVEAVRAADPGAPAWSMPARAAFAFVIIATCAGILAKRRIALYAYFAISLVSLPLNAARGVTSIPALIGGAVAAPVIVWLLVRKDLAALR